jgi:uncharacterized Fe-S cluster-containing radical SAM superfamily protein
MPINTEELSLKYRKSIVKPDEKKILITNFINSGQEGDFTVPPNCNGYGRVRHFRRETSKGWPSNPLPIDPACKSLSMRNTDMIKAQVFQIAACNWRCWYCFVPYKLLEANIEYSGWKTPSELINLYVSQKEPPRIIDLTGGQPGLVPEWVPWMMEELTQRGLEKEVYLWTDDNLSNDYFWKFLSNEEIELINSYPNYGRVCCFKGFNQESFSFNTNAHPELFIQQFELMRRFLTLDIDLYAYVTLTSPEERNIKEDIRIFMDKLQQLDENLPLRTVPLEIQTYTPVKSRISDIHHQALKNQQVAIEAWNLEIENRFTYLQRNRNIADVPLRQGRKI